MKALVDAERTLMGVQSVSEWLAQKHFKLRVENFYSQASGSNFLKCSVTVNILLNSLQDLSRQRVGKIHPVSLKVCGNQEMGSEWWKQRSHYENCILW